MISILNKRSSGHSNWCEDNYYVKEFDNHIVGAVLDGCSTGINSHFASTLIKYSLETSINEDVNIRQLLTGRFEDYYYQIIGDVRSDLIDIQRTLKLADLHLLSTIVFFVYHKSAKKLYVKFFGDGVIYVNGNEIVNDENNTPDYLAYHLTETWSGFFGKVLPEKRFETYESVTNFSICSDGIHSLVNLKNPHINKQVAINFLVIDEQWNNQANGLNKKFNILTNKDDAIKRSEELYWWDIKDDLTIIRYATI